MKRRTIFKLVGLSMPKSTTCLSLNDKHTFNAPLVMTHDRFKALFEYFKTGGRWEGDEFAVIEYDKLSEDGIPIDPLVVEIKILTQ